MLEIILFMGRLSGDKVGLYPVQYEHHQFQGDVKKTRFQGKRKESRSLRATPDNVVFV